MYLKYEAYQFRKLVMTVVFLQIKGKKSKREREH